MVNEKTKNVKNSTPSLKNKPSTVNPDDWTFDVRVSTTTDGDLEEVRTPVKRTILENAKAQRDKKNREKLELENSPRESITRAQMAERLKNDDNTQDIFIFANPLKRVLAAILDLMLLGLFTYVGRLLILPIYRLNIMIMDRYHYNLTIPKISYYHYAHFVIFGIVYFVLMVIGTAFYNKTPGKKLLGLTVRGDTKFSLQVTDIFLREVLLKPLSIISVVGILMALFHKQRKTLHDILVKTMVVES